MPHVPRLRPAKAATAAATMGVLLAGGLTAATAAQASTHRDMIADTHPSWATGHAAASPRAL